MQGHRFKSEDRISVQRRHPDYQKLVERTRDFLDEEVGNFDLSYLDTLIIVNHEDDGSSGVIDGVLRWAGYAEGDLDLDRAWQQHVFDAGGFVVTQPGLPDEPVMLIYGCDDAERIWVSDDKLDKDCLFDCMPDISPEPSPVIAAWEEWQSMAEYSRLMQVHAKSQIEVAIAGARGSSSRVLGLE